MVIHLQAAQDKRPRKRLVNATESNRETFVVEYSALGEEAERTGAKLFFAGKAHFRAEAELRGKWVLKGEPALVESTIPKYGEKASYYSTVCLETGEVEWMQLAGNIDSATSLVFLKQLLEAVAGEARRDAEPDPGQCPSTPRRSAAGVPQDPRPESAASKSARMQPEFRCR